MLVNDSTSSLLSFGVIKLRLLILLCFGLDLTPSSIVNLTWDSLSSFSLDIGVDLSNFEYLSTTEMFDSDLWYVDLKYWGLWSKISSFEDISGFMIASSWFLFLSSFKSTKKYKMNTKLYKILFYYIIKDKVHEKDIPSFKD